MENTKSNVLELPVMCSGETAGNHAIHDCDKLEMMLKWIKNRMKHHKESLSHSDKPIHYDNLLFHRHSLQLLQDMEQLFFPPDPGDEANGRSCQERNDAKPT